MTFLLKLILQALSFITITSQAINGTWQGDWQNTATLGCSPISFTIVGNSSSGYNITYYFMEAIHSLCEEFGLTNYSSPLTLTPNTTDTWTDNDKQKLVYNSTNQLLYGYFSYAMGSPLLFSLNGSSIPEQEAIGYLTGVWQNPTPINSSDASSCCAPDTLYIRYVPTDIYGISYFQLSSIYYYNTSSSCSGNGTQNDFEIIVPNPETLNFTATLGPYEDHFFFTPFLSITHLTLILKSNTSCSFSYQKSISLIPNNTWQRDWQSDYLPSLSSYQVMTVNNSYMISTVTFIDNTTQNGYLAGTADGRYYDLVTDQYFTYDNITNSMLAGGLLLSPNGSLFYASPFDGNWQNPQKLLNGPLNGSLTNCCYPFTINITSDSDQANVLNAVYNIPSNYTNYYCSNFSNSSALDITSQLYIAEPNVTQLVWTDKTYGHTLFFGEPGETFVIQVSNFSGNCSFTMLATAAVVNWASVLQASILMTLILSIFSLVML